MYLRGITRLNDYYYAWMEKRYPLESRPNQEQLDWLCDITECLGGVYGFFPAIRPVRRTNQSDEWEQQHLTPSEKEAVKAMIDFTIALIVDKAYSDKYDLAIHKLFVDEMERYPLQINGQANARKVTNRVYWQMLEIKLFTYNCLYLLPNILAESPLISYKWLFDQAMEKERNDKSGNRPG